MIRKRETVSILWLQSATWMKNVRISYLLSFIYISVVSNKEYRILQKCQLTLYILLIYKITSASSKLVVEETRVIFD